MNASRRAKSQSSLWIVAGLIGGFNVQSKLPSIPCGFGDNENKKMPQFR
jgi:hypothetical protein